MKKQKKAKKVVKKRIDIILRIQYRWLILLIVIAAVIVMASLQVFSSDSTEDDIENDRYLLSAISQGLAALFALIFTISLIILQVSYRDPNLINEFLKNKFIILYSLLIGVGIIFPLIVLKISCYKFCTNIAIAIAFACVFLVVPFFLKMKDFLRFNVGIRETVKLARQAIDKTDVLGYKNILWEILGLSQSAINEKNYIIVTIALHELLLLSKYSKDRKVFGVVDETIKQFGIHLRFANREGILKDIYPILVEASKITDHILQLDKDTYESLAITLSDTAESASNDEFKRIVCCSTWVFSAKWLARNPNEDKLVKRQINYFVSKVGSKLALECNDLNGPQYYYENASTQLRLDTHRDSADSQMLDELRSWIKNSKKDNSN